MVLCHWCKSPRPIDVQGAEALAPGLHKVIVEVIGGTCIPCGTKFSDGISKGGVTESDTSARKNQEEK